MIYIAKKPIFKNGKIELVEETLTSLSLKELELLDTDNNSMQLEINKYNLIVSYKKYEKVIEIYKNIYNNGNDTSKILNKYPFLKGIKNNNFNIPLTKSRTNKVLSRFRIKNEVRDDKDSIADLAKWNSLLTTMVGLLYNTQSETTKNKLGEENRMLIETALEKFSRTKTNGDYQFELKGLRSINEILDKEAQIGKIISETKGEQ